MRSGKIAVLAVGVLTLAAGRADAFCGFYVGGAGADLYNNATQVVIMRAGTTTVLSMQNNYQGPTSDFALVVPVPVVLQKEHVKTLTKAIFTRVDKLAAPRLVEYWEEDPCRVAELDKMVKTGAPPVESEVPTDMGVKIEAQFTVGEYEIVILSATESTGLESWLKQQKYAIPDGAAKYLDPYVQGGSKFFVAKVDVKKVTFNKQGQAMLSPLRIQYESQEFTLPIRLGMMNAKDTQDLIVHILAPGQRYDVANYEPVTIPTNLEVKDETRKRFGEFYAALFDATLEKNPGAVVTEYAWDATSCDPCPEPPLQPEEIATLGNDVVQSNAYGFVLTRLHARYPKDGIKDDLVFKAAPPIVGGREFMGANGVLEERSRPGSINNFQGRYIIRHPWTATLSCKNPVHGRWGAPPNGPRPNPVAATDLAFAPRGKIALPKMVRQDVPEIGVVAAVGAPISSKGPGPEGTNTGKSKKSGGCGSCVAGGGDPSPLSSVLLLAAIAIALRRRRTSR